MSYRVTLLNAVLIALTIVGVTTDAEASRRKPRRIVLQGEIQQLSTSFVVLNNTRVELTARTVYRDYADAVISQDAFTLGDCIKVKLIPGRLVPTAREMEMEDHCSASTGTGIVKPSPGATTDDKGGQRGGSVGDDCNKDDSSDRGRGRGRGRGRDDK